MIRVNLLPQEYRKAEATPLKQFFATVGAAVIVTLSVVFFGYVHFVNLPKKESELNTLNEEIKTQEAPVKQSKDLDAMLQDFMNQCNTIDKVAENRLVLSRKLDEFWEVICNPPPGRYDVWLKTLSFNLGQKGPKSGGVVQFSGLSAGAPVAKISDFHEAVKQSEFFKDCVEITYPWGQKSQLTKDREPTEGWDFNFTVNLKPMKDLYADRAKAAQETKQ